MDCDQDNPFAILLSSEQDCWQNAIVQVKRLVIGSNRQKAFAIQQGILPRFFCEILLINLVDAIGYIKLNKDCDLTVHISSIHGYRKLLIERLIDVEVIRRLLSWLMDDSVPLEIRTEAAIVLGSLAWGQDTNVASLLEVNAVPALLKGLFNSNMAHCEACLRCLRTIFLVPNPPAHFLYEDPAIIPHLLKLMPSSVTTKEAIANILASGCTCYEHQDALCKAGAVPILTAHLSEETLYKIQMPVLKAIAAMCQRNLDVCRTVSSATYNAVSVPFLINKLQARDKMSEMQMMAAKCLTHLFCSGSMPSSETVIKLATLHTLVHMCKKDRTLEENVDGAETLFCLIEEDPVLQEVASICDHSLRSLAEYLSYADIQQIDSRQAQKNNINWSNALKKAAFQVFAAMAANNEDIRKKIVDIANLLGYILSGLSSGDEPVQIATCRCLHSLSRSVQQIRTTFQDFASWKTLVKLMESDSVEMRCVASATVCNMLLEFSPCKDAIVEFGAIPIFVELCKKEDEQLLRLNGVWGLMNIAFNSDTKCRMQIVETLGSDLLFVLLSEHNEDIVLRTLGLLRNIFARKSHVDDVMAVYGKDVIKGVKFILVADHPGPRIKEQCLCIVANIADGIEGKMTILNDEEIMGYLYHNLHSCNWSQLQSTAIWAIKNLVNEDIDGLHKRVSIMREFGIHHALEKLTQLKDSCVSERAKQALNAFL